MNMNIDKDLIRQLRLDKSWSQEKLAEAAEMNLRTIQRIEKDGAASLQSCTAIARAFGIEPKILMLGSLHPRKPPLFYHPQLVPALLINSIVFILWGLSQFVAQVLPLSAYQHGMLSFLFFFFAGVVLLAFLTPLASRRRLGLVACLLLAMVLSPASPGMQMLVVLPMWGLFELSLLLARRSQLAEYALQKPS